MPSSSTFRVPSPAESSPSSVELHSSHQSAWTRSLGMPYHSSFSSDRRPPVAAGGGRTTSPSVEDAMGFVQMVKEAFKDRHPDKYHLFLRVMDDFRNQRADIAEVATTARALFQDCPDLALGFNVFLPKGHRIPAGLDELADSIFRDMNLDDDDDDGRRH